MRSTSTAEAGAAVAGETGMQLRDLDGHVYRTDGTCRVSRITGTTRPGVAHGDVLKIGDPDVTSREAAVLATLGGFVAPLLRCSGTIAEGPFAGAGFIVTEYVGPDLSEVLSDVHNHRRPALSADVVDRLALDLVEVLSALEGRGIEALQLRPEHVLLPDDPTRSVCLCGWGSTTGGELDLPAAVPESQPVAGRTHLFLWASLMRTVLASANAGSNPTALRRAVSECSAADPWARPAGAAEVRVLLTAPEVSPEAERAEPRVPVDHEHAPAPTTLALRIGHALARSEKPGMQPDLRLLAWAVFATIGVIVGLTLAGLLLGR